VNSQLFHKSVLLNECMDALNLADAKLIVDATLGFGGHTKSMLELNSELKVIGFDVDLRNLEIARENLADFTGRVEFVNRNFSELPEYLEENEIFGLDGVLFDLGVSSAHFDDAERGFSLKKDGDLDMRLDLSLRKTAADIVNYYESVDLARIFRDFGEEKFARKIADAICKRRKIKKFVRTLELADFINDLVVGKSQKPVKIHPATRVFQALRIEVNNELGVIESTLNKIPDYLKIGGRLAVISFHSLEDRVVKQVFKLLSKEYVNLPDLQETTYLNPKLKIINKKPLEPTSEEVRENSRSRSAKLRIAERI